MLLYKTVCALSTASLSVPVSVCGFKETIQHCLNPRRLFITFQGEKKRNRQGIQWVQRPSQVGVL